MQKNANINRLYLDSKNPRHFPIENQKEIIEFLIENEKIKPLAKDIAEKGLTNPLDLVGITKENDKRVVLEGNRRICALKLLLDPSLAPKKYQKYFENLKQKVDTPIKKIPVYQFSSRSEAQPWLSTLHTASSKTSRKSWSTEQQTRFEQETNGKPDNAAALTILEFSLRHDLIHPGQSQKVITTITRMLSSPEVRQAFGIITGVRERNIKINITVNEFKDILRQYFSDFDDEHHNIGSRSMKSDRLKYVAHLTALRKIPTKRLENPLALLPRTTSSESVPNSQQTKTSRGSNNTRSRKTRKGEIINYDLTIKVSKIMAIYLEIRDKLDVYETPYSVSALLRSLVEQSCDYFLVKIGETISFHDGGKTESIKESSKLRAKILGIAQYFKTHNHLDEKELTTLINECATRQDGTGTLNLLHSILHNYAHNISPEQVISAHNNLKPFIIAIWEKYHWPNGK